MPIEFRCTQCGQMLRVAESSAGKNARCPGCQTIVPVPVAGDLASRAYVPLSAPSAPPVPPPPSPLPVPPSPQDDLFAYLKQATTPVGQAPPTQPAAPGPFAELQPAAYAAAPLASSANPYESPSGAYPALAPPAADRPGLPWETQPMGIASWWQTSQLCLGDAEKAFREMRQEGGVGSPLLFACWGQLLGFLGQALWSVPAMALQLLAAAQQQNQFAGTEIIVNLILMALMALFTATFGLFIGAAVTHLCLLLVGGANRGYETTYRVAAFTAGSIAWLSIIPFFGPLIAVVMTFVCLIQGLAQAQETTVGRAAAAVFLPLGLCLVLGCAGVVAIIAIIANQ